MHERQKVKGELQCFLDLASAKLNIASSLSLSLSHGDPMIYCWLQTTAKLLT